MHVAMNKRIFLLFCGILYCLTGMGQELVKAPLLENVKIAFVSYKTGSAEVYLMNSDGSDVEQITNSPENNSFPYQIDARTLGFIRRDSLRNMTDYQIDIYTKEEEPLAREPSRPDAEWDETSPDGRYIAFVRSTDYSDRELFIYNTELQQEIRITNNSDEGFAALSFGYSWSANGKKLLFMSGVDWYHQVMQVYDVETEKIRTVTARGYMNSGVKWLKDNENVIANLKIRDETLYELYNVNTTTGEVTQLTTDINLHPNVSPDGEWVVFESQRHNNDGEVYVMRKDGSDQIRLTNNNDYNGRATWFELEKN